MSRALPLADHGFYPKDELTRFCQPGALLGGYVDAHVPGIDHLTGPFGHGLPVGAGAALLACMQQSPSRVFVVLWDGEVGEGSFSEGALIAAKHRLSNVTTLVDDNQLQSYGRLEDELPLEPMADKWRAFGYCVLEVTVMMSKRHVTCLPHCRSIRRTERGYRTLYQRP